MAYLDRVFGEAIDGPEKTGRMLHLVAVIDNINKSTSCKRKEDGKELGARKIERMWEKIEVS